MFVVIVFDDFVVFENAIYGVFAVNYKDEFCIFDFKHSYNQSFAFAIYIDGNAWTVNPTQF